MADVATYCAVTGLCYNLATQFLMKVPWQNVLKEVAVTSGKKVWSSRNAYRLVLREAEMAQRIYKNFADTVHQIDQYQQSLGVAICSLGTAQSFLQDFEKVLQMYDPKQLSVWETNMAGESLRQQLQYYITFMHSIMGNIHLELSYVTMQLQTIQMESDQMQRAFLTSQLRKRTCSSNYARASLLAEPPNESFGALRRTLSSMENPPISDKFHSSDEEYFDAEEV